MKNFQQGINLLGSGITNPDARQVVVEKYELDQMQVQFLITRLIEVSQLKKLVSVALLLEGTLDPNHIG